MKTTRADNLEERIEAIRAEVNAIIEARAEAVAKENPGVPAGVIRNLLTARAPACLCAQYIELKRVDGSLDTGGGGRD
jgi:hypothetical protein